MRILEKIDDITGYIYVIELCSLKRVDIKEVTHEQDNVPYYYILEAGVYHLVDNEPVYENTTYDEDKLLSEAISLIKSQKGAVA